MDLIRAAITRPVAVVAAVFMVLMFGYVALERIPIQLTPDVRKPVLTVETLWPGAAPAEVEREIVNRQEEVFKGLDGLVRIESRSETGRSRVTLEFNVGQNMDNALILVSNRLQRVANYPEEVQRPQIKTQGTDDNAIAFFVITRLPGNTKPIQTFSPFVEDYILDRLERVEGVSGSEFFGRSDEELRVIVDPALLAQYKLTVSDVLSALRRANAAVTGGEVDEGKRSYVVRTEGELKTVQAVKSVLVRSTEDSSTGRIARVTIGDIARVEFGFKKPSATIRASGETAMVARIFRETGANVMEVMRGVRAAVKELNEGIVKARGLRIEQVYDETDYITSAVDLVQQNIWMGGLLAALVLLIFLRSPRATIVISLAIPISVIGSFVAMAALGRSINVISLAGIAFAVGMVVDAAIVVLENIFRLKEEGKPMREAAYLGAKQVWGAILVSALTTVMVFIPILTMELEVGQLFRDIAVAISVSVLLSLLVAITLIPALSNWLLTSRKEKAGEVDAGPHKMLPLPGIDHFGRAFVATVMGITRATVSSKFLSILMIAGMTGAGAVATWLFLPKLEYLPTGNRNLIIAISLPPPGYNLETMTDLARKAEAIIKPHLATPEQMKRGALPTDPPLVERFFFVARNAQNFMGAASLDPQRAKELIPLIRRAVNQETGTFGLVFQPSLFGRSVGGGRSIDLDISGPDLEKNLEVALRAFILINRHLPRDQGNQVRPRPGLTLGAPELRVLPDRVKLADNGVTAAELAETIDAFNDGMRVVQINVGGRRIDLTLMGTQGKITATQGIGDIPVVTRSGTIVPVRSLADVKVTAGATEILHVERTRTVTLSISPSPDIPLEAAMDIVRTKIMQPLIKQGLPPGVKMGLSGEADQLTKTWNAMVIQLILALVIVYLVMAVLFESFLYPFIIMFSVPLATAGGILGLYILNLYTKQQLDMLTLLGFVILIGTVVNNAILLVHQGLANMRELGMDVKEAILDSTRTRIRPIFMSTLTSVCGMFPLVLFPGAGSELYRGLGSVVLGGLALSAVLTLLIIPPLMILFIRSKKEVGRAVETPPATHVAAPHPSGHAAAPGE